jgi:tetratricopeptide (TPR) repeat protein
MSQFPDSADGARQTATMLAAAGKWDEALQAGLAWRIRAGSRGRVADVFVSQVMLRLGRAADAVAVLAPRIEVALAHPAASESLLLTYCVALCGYGRSTTATEVLAALSRKSDRWRLLPLMLEPGQWTTSAAGADAWLAVCAANVPVDDPNAQLALARAWSAAWSKFRSAEMLASARQILARLTSTPDSTAEIWHEAGLLEHAAGDLVAARRRYLGALDKDPDHAVTHNDLAMLLADAGQWREAVVHATKATELLPGDANCRDTLAHALRVGGQFDDAAAALVEACRLDPANPKWRLELAEVYAESGRTQDAEREAARVDEMASLGAGLPAAQRERLRLLRVRFR